MDFTIGEDIKNLRTSKGLTQQELSRMTGISVNSLSRYERGLRQPTVEAVSKIAKALGIDPFSLFSFDMASNVLSDSINRNYFWTADLEDKLKQVGCSIGYYEEDAYIWINYPDGTLEVSLAELEELHESSNDFLRFKLEELRKKHAKNFRPQRSDDK